MKIYMASKAKHGPRWRALRDDHGVPINSSWIDEAEEGLTSDWADLWSRCVNEACEADAVILYCEPGEVLKGALVEVGAALAVGNKVYAVGCEGHSFLAHPQVQECVSLGEALDNIAR